MAKKRRLGIVIDASIARGAGVKNDRRSRTCRQFLRWVFRYCHHLVLSNEIETEWHRHQSRFTLRWLKTMADRDKIDRKGALNQDALRNRIAALPIKLQCRRAMAKDAALIVAAQVGDRVIVSLDNKARDLFNRHAETLRTPKGILWRNPEEDNIP